MRCILQNKIKYYATRDHTLLFGLWLQKPGWYLADENPDHLLAAVLLYICKNQINKDSLSGSFYKLCI